MRETAAVTNGATETMGQGMAWVFALFFVSGFPALLYQVVWQRALFTIYGVNIESVTIIVSAFMLGLGLGSLAGGWVSAQPGSPLLALFGLIELGIAFFGIFSMRIFHYVAQFTAGGGALSTGAITFGLLLVPTALMGSTLPILTEHLVRLSGNVGRSVASLYFVNTLGSATACFAAALFLMYQFGESGTAAVAAAFNATIGLSVLGLHFLNKKSRSRTGRPEAENAEPPAPTAHLDASTLPFRVAAPVAALAGLVSLAYEILWYRACSVAFGGRAPAFAVLLGFYLTGVAFGALVSKPLCRPMSAKTARRHLTNISLFVIGANLVGFFVLPVMTRLALYHVALALPLITVAAALLGATLPLITHAAVLPDHRAGRGLSWLYFSNIIGSALGSFLVGYVLMDIWTIRQIAVAIALTGLTLGTAILATSTAVPRTRLLNLAGCAGLAIFFVASAGPLFDQFYERLEAKRNFTTSYVYRDVVETRSGVAAVTQDLETYGGGVYDGWISTDLVDGSNMLYRPFSLSAWHPNPRETLVIGLSTGAWTQVIANNPQVRSVTVVEINPGYLRLIAKYPAVASLLRNPKFSVSIDDGRRWLMRHPDARFDVIISNTTFNWRAQSSNLLSAEFLKLIRRHLKPGGVFFYNTTDAGGAQLTGVTVFPYARMIGNCIAVSDTPISIDASRWRRVMDLYRIDGVPVINTDDPRHQKKLTDLIALYANSEDADGIRTRTARERIITDDNMGTEWHPMLETMRKAFRD